ncbi:MAG TPA: Mrp/NBP35 family ATP-binding protein [Elusimicrobiota bacterium]|nr:Mrp/NBP35 family ATP-binding protein [Elusimicrobiota bacterium]
MITEESILKALSSVVDPDLHRDIVSLGFIKKLTISGRSVSFEIHLTTPACPMKEKIRSQAVEAVRTVPGVEKVDVTMAAQVRRTIELTKDAVKDVKNFVAIASGKGGVGKSTVAVNLAVALVRRGARVGLLDADIYGPSVPSLLGPSASIETRKDGTILPAVSCGVKFMSMGFIAPGDKPLIWRGPMAHNALQQSLFRVQWGELDYLLVDLPPGTGDIHLTLVQSIPMTGGVIVSTPQDVGLTISMKTFRMFQSTDVRILGLIENMSYHRCPQCGHREEIFGHGTVSSMAHRLQVPFLGAIPLESRVREQADRGVPVVEADPSSPLSQTYFEIADRLAAAVSVAGFDSPPVKNVKEPLP